ncbi:COG1470 family protein [Streptomyces sp. NPDC002536]
MQPRTRAAALAVPAVAAVLLAAPAAAEPQPWWAAPSGGRSAIALEGVPGTVFEDKLSVVNPGTAPRTVELRATGAWIALAERRVRIPPRTRADVPLTVTVPTGAVPGEHPAAVTVTGEGRQLQVPVTVRVTGPTLAALAVEHVRVSGTGRGTVIHYALVNRGNTVLAPHLEIRAVGVFGEVLHRTPDGVPAELPPGRSLRLTEPWPGAPRLDRVRVSVTATAPGAAHSTASDTYMPLPWLLPGLGAAVAAAAAYWLVRRRRKAVRP